MRWYVSIANQSVAMFDQGFNTMDNSCSPSLYVVSLFALFCFSLCSTIHCEVLPERYLDQLHSSNFILYGSSSSYISAMRSVGCLRLLTMLANEVLDMHSLIRAYVSDLTYKSFSLFKIPSLLQLTQHAFNQHFYLGLRRV
jgi:hypothetical protein